MVCPEKRSCSSEGVTNWFKLISIHFSRVASFGEIDSEILLTRSMSPCKPVTNRVRFGFFRHVFGRFLGGGYLYLGLLRNPKFPGKKKQKNAFR